MTEDRLAAPFRLAESPSQIDIIGDTRPSRATTAHLADVFN
ncbi:MAG: hypothetical protein ACKVH8_17805 [Pirellulales bacterium]